MARRWRMAGILIVVAGAIAIVIGLVVVLMAGGVAGGLQLVPDLPELALRLPLIGGLGLPLVLLGMVALVGGVCWLRTRAWGMGLLGAVSAVLCFAPLGVPALILVLRCRGGSD